VLTRALPFDPDMPDQRGVYQLPTGASGEFMIKEMKGEPKPPAKGKAPLVPLGHVTGRVKALANFDELTEILKRISRPGSTLQETLFKFYDCRSKISTGSNTNGIHVVTDPFASLVTTTQPARLRKQLTKDDAYSGFLNRFVFTAGPRKPKPTRGRVKIDLTNSANRLELVHEWIQQVHSGDLNLEWSEEAGELWDEFCEKTIYPTEDAGSEAIKRISVVMIKLVMLFSINAHEATVSKSSVESAIGLWDYMLRTYKAVDDQVMISSVTEMEEDVLDAVKTMLSSPKCKKPYVTASEVCTKLRRRYSRQDIYRTIEMLVKIGELDEVEPPRTAKGGRPPKGGYTVRSLLA